MAAHNLRNRMVEVVDCDVNDEVQDNRQTYDSVLVVQQQEMPDPAILGGTDIQYFSSDKQ